jgi:3-oxoacyl-[acyl-carrier-protein] synthase-3
MFQKKILYLVNFKTQIMYQSKIIGLGKYVPERVVTNDELTNYMDTSDEWIRERTGIEERRWVQEGYGNTTAVMGAKAARQALDRAGLKPSDIDFIVFATLSPEYYFPGSGVLLQELLEMPTIGALDVRNQCSGFVYATAVADQFIKTGVYKTILVVGAEVQSTGLDLSTRGRGVSVIFGDGAGAMVITRTEEKDKGFLAHSLHSEGKYADQLIVKYPSSAFPSQKFFEHLQNNPDETGHFPYMNGNFVFKNAVVRFQEAIAEVLQKAGLGKEDLDLLIPHQANLRISQFIQKMFGLKPGQVYNNIQRYGNTTAASIPIALTEAWEDGKIKDGDLVVLAAFGSGFTWGANLIRW